MLGGRLHAPRARRKKGERDRAGPRAPQEVPGPGFLFEILKFWSLSFQAHLLTLLVLSVLLQGKITKSKLLLAKYLSSGVAYVVLHIFNRTETTYRSPSQSKSPNLSPQGELAHSVPRSFSR